MNVPANLKYTKDHEWISVDGDVATIGITDFAQSELGDIVFVEIETVGETMDQEEVFGSDVRVDTQRYAFVSRRKEHFDGVENELANLNKFFE